MPHATLGFKRRSALNGEDSTFSADLRYRALAEIRKQPGCSNVQGIAINRVSDQHSENNWSLCVSSAGTADANSAAHAALRVQSVLRRDYDLLPD
jgi:hypothetical protein